MKHLPHIMLLLCASLFVGCAGQNTLSLADFTVEQYNPEYASGFSITATENGQSTLLTIRNPWQGAQGVQQQILIARNDEQPPAGFAGQIVRSPARRVVCMSSSHVAMLDAVDEVRRVVGVSGIDYISNSYINDHKLCGEVRDVGHDTDLNFELLLSLRPSVVLLYGVTGENAAVTGKLTELGIPYIYIGDYVEESPLGKAEWLVAMAELSDCMERGQERFAAIRDRYNALRDQVEANQTAKRLRVMLNTPYRDTWFMPSSRSYMVQLINDAGGEYIYTQNSGTSSVPIDAEQAYRLAHEADVWLNVGQLTSMSELKQQNPRFAELPVVRAGEVYNNNRRRTVGGGSDFWESGIVCPDKILGDLIHIFHGGPHPLTYYQRLE